MRIFLATVLVATLLAVSGAFGTGYLSIGSGIAYWAGLAALGTAIGILVSRRLIPRPWLATKPWFAWGLIALAIALPMTLVVALLGSLLHHRPFRLGLIFEVFPATLATTAAMTALAFLLRPRGPEETHAAAEGAPPAKFLARLTAKLRGGELLAVEAQDHYLRLHTDKGDDLILMRLTDAIAELEGIEGARTHRSWWVAKSAVIGAERGDGRATLTLKNDLEAPVSRAYSKSLRDAGWF